MNTILAIIGAIFLLAILCVLLPVLVVVLWYAIEIGLAALAVWGLVKLVRYIIREFDI